MVDLLAAGLAWLDGQRERHLTRAVRYLRPATASEPELQLTVPATIGRTLFRLDSLGVTERIETRDFLIGATHLADLAPPRRGDRITEADGTTRIVHEVLALGREPHWRWADPDRRAYRIHTKFLLTEPIP